ncbi:molecular chaperone [Altererythrobacter aerius]|uniref:Molecular chaperone n=1 Tax=Tsuneonella aeria TaxID=1837929 RepID=A0A6I4TE40_9SPHN|nr:ATP12 family protein [Tsuneonella aeria]MXO74648.1 molecular chaperone [Tsuneonella aeria]
MKRFWNEVAIQQAGGGWQVALDGRAIRTQGGAPQIVPTRALAEMLAAEWRAQGETVDTTGFPARDMADHAIDSVTSDPEAVIAKLLRYAESDTLCYRADPDEALHRRQWEVWEPLVAAFEAREGVRMDRVSGIIHRSQPSDTLDRLRARLTTIDPFTLAALEVMTALSASLCVGLGALEVDADPQALWDAAELEETWQAELWGVEPEAEARRKQRARAFLHAAAFARAARAG